MNQIRTLLQQQNMKLRKVIRSILIVAAMNFCVFVRAADTSTVLIVPANCLDGRTLGVCFPEPLDPASATNVTHYALNLPDTSGAFTVTNSEYVVSSAFLRLDQKSVVLQLNKPYPGSVLRLLINGVRDLTGRPVRAAATPSVGNLEILDIGHSGVDPKEGGSVFSCRDQVFEITAGGSGIRGTNDSFTFVYQPWRISSLTFGGQIDSIEPINRFSTAAFMVRENLTPGSRFLSIAITPPEVATKDGSGNGANKIQIIYRDVSGAQSREITITNGLIAGLTNIAFEVRRSGNLFDIYLSQPQYVKLGEFNFASGFSSASFVGMATSSQSNAEGFVAQARYSNYRIRHTDFPSGPKLTIQKSSGEIIVAWKEPADLSYHLISSSEYRAAYWPAVELDTFKAPENDGLIWWNARVMVPASSPQQFFSLSLSRQ